jgi:putative transposase
MILQIQRGLSEDGFTVPMTKLCCWFDVPRRTVCDKLVKSKPKVQDRFATPIKHMIEAEPSFGYRTVASFLRFNKNTVQRVFQLMGGQVRKRAIGPLRRWLPESDEGTCREVLNKYRELVK